MKSRAFSFRRGAKGQERDSGRQKPSLTLNWGFRYTDISTHQNSLKGTLKRVFFYPIKVYLKKCFLKEKVKMAIIHSHTYKLYYYITH